MSLMALVFPGQGSQSIGMLRDLADYYPRVKDLFLSVSDPLGFDLWELVQHGPHEVLNQTAKTQVAMLVADVAIYTLLKECGLVEVAMMAGHSLGEYAALVCAGAIELVDAVLLVEKRGTLMQATVPLGQGAMAAIVGLSDETVRALCAEVSLPTSSVTPANYNAIGQVVVAGHSSAVERVITLAEQQGARLARMIPVSVPCHCPLLAETALQFAEVLESISFNVPGVPVISNVDLSVYQSVTQIKTLLSAQLYSPVRWVETIQYMKKQGISIVIECGPGKVLGGLIKRIEPSLQVMSVNDKASLDAFVHLQKDK